MRLCARMLMLLLLCGPLGAQAQSARARDILGRESELSLNDAIRMALENNLSLEIARTDPEVAFEVVRQSEGAYDPFFTAGASYDDDETPTSSGIQGVDSLLTEQWNYNAGLQGSLPFGLEYSSQYNLWRTESNSIFFQLFPEWRAVWGNELRLPLLRDLFDNETDITVKRSRVSRDISLDEFRRQLIDEIRDVERAYWALVANLDAQRVADKSLETAKSLLEQTQVRYDVGVVSRVAVTQAVSGEARRESDLIVARNRTDRSQDQLLRLIAAPGPEGYKETTLIPESPTLVEYEIDLDQTVRKALATRPEMAVAKGRLEDAQLASDLANNQSLPTLDLVGRYDLAGLSGDTGDPLNPFPREDSIDAHDDFFRARGEHSWGVKAEFSVPLPNTSARALATQRRIELRRARTNLRQIEQEVIFEARDAVRTLRAALEVIKAEERAKEAAAEVLRAEQEKLRLGDSTPFDVLQFEEDLAEAENSLVSALRVYRNAITDLERAQDTLLESHGISLADELARR